LDDTSKQRLNLFQAVSKKKEKKRKEKKRRKPQPVTKK
jgi:hypothetical protein